MPPALTQVGICCTAQDQSALLSSLLPLSPTPTLNPHIPTTVVLSHSPHAVDAMERFSVTDAPQQLVPHAPIDPIVVVYKTLYSIYKQWYVSPCSLLVALEILFCREP